MTVSKCCKLAEQSSSSSRFLASHICFLWNLEFKLKGCLIWFVPQSLIITLVIKCENHPGLVSNRPSFPQKNHNYVVNSWRRRQTLPSTSGLKNWVGVLLKPRDPSSVKYTRSWNFTFWPLLQCKTIYFYSQSIPIFSSIFICFNSSYTHGRCFFNALCDMSK